MHKVLDISGLGNRTYLPDGAPPAMLGPQTPEPSCSAAYSVRASSAVCGTCHIGTRQARCHLPQRTVHT